MGTIQDKLNRTKEIIELAKQNPFYEQLYYNEEKLSVKTNLERSLENIYCPIENNTHFNSQILLHSVDYYTIRELIDGDSGYLILNSHPILREDFCVHKCYFSHSDYTFNFKFITTAGFINLKLGKTFQDMLNSEPIILNEHEVAYDIPSEYRNCILYMAIYSYSPDFPSNQIIHIDFENNHHIFYSEVCLMNNMENTDYLFSNCINLRHISSFRTIAPITKYAFYNCYNLKSVDSLLYGSDNRQFVDTIRLGDDVSYAFYNCRLFKGFKKPIEFQSTNREMNVSHMFENCYSLDNIEFKNSQSSITYYPIAFSNTSYMFANCFNLKTIKEINLSESLIQTDHMFENCINLRKISFYSGIDSNGNFSLKYNNIDGTGNAEYMFYNCKLLEYIYSEGYNIKVMDINSSNILNANYMFANCSIKSSFYLSNTNIKRDNMLIGSNVYPRNSDVNYN